MKLIALEEHLVTREIYEAWKRLPVGRWNPSIVLYSRGETLAWPDDVSERRLRDMDDSGVDIQVLSLVAPGLHALDAASAVPLARNLVKLGHTVRLDILAYVTFRIKQQRNDRLTSGHSAKRQSGRACTWFQ